jgi:hypothetical protein
MILPRINTTGDVPSPGLKIEGLIRRIGLSTRMLDYCQSGYAKPDVELSHPTKTYLFLIAAMDASVVDSSDPFTPSEMGLIDLER